MIRVLGNTNMQEPHMGWALRAYQGRSLLFFAQEFFFFKQEHGPPGGSEHKNADVLLTTNMGPVRCGSERYVRRFPNEPPRANGKEATNAASTPLSSPSRITGPDI